MQSLDNMIIFAAVVEAGGFTAAAKTLALSTPVISKRINALEKELNTKLLFRTTRQVQLTDAGREYYQYCVQVSSLATEAQMAVSSLNDMPSGLLRISAPQMFGEQHMPSALALFLEQYPNIDIELDLNDRKVDIAKEGFDVAIRFTSQPPPLNFVAKPIIHGSRVVCASPDYWEKYGYPSEPSDLTEHNCLLFTALPNYDQWIFSQQDKTETVKVTSHFTTNHAGAVMEAAIKGIGVTMLSSLVVGKAVKSGQLTTALNNYTTVKSHMYAICLPSLYQSRKVKVFIEFIKHWCQQYVLIE
jgi:DNA-binding transcriptional LysR family regulator